MRSLLPLLLSNFFFTLSTSSALAAVGDTSAETEIANCIKSTFGCIPTNPVQLVSLILQIGLGIAGGIAFLMMVYGSIKLISSAGNPESISQGKEFLTYAILGMLIIVFSVFILTLIGVKILKIPGLG